jgi:hypothetical protein
MKEKRLERIFSEDADWAQKEAEKLNKNATSKESIATVIRRAIEAYRYAQGMKKPERR